MNTNKLKEVLNKHKLWLEGKEGGESANLSFANLRDADLRDADLRDADLRDADLRDADLRDANLSGSDLSGSNLSGSDLSGANLNDSNLRGANLRGANLSGSKFWNTLGNKKEIITIQTPKYTINIINNEYLQIGCKQYSIVAWLNFDDNTIKYMDKGALAWWKVYKPIIELHLKANKVIS